MRWAEGAGCVSEAAHGGVGGDKLHEEHLVRVQARTRARGIDKASGSWGGVRGAAVGGGPSGKHRVALRYLEASP